LGEREEKRGILWFGKRSFRRHQSGEIKSIILSIHFMDLDISCCVHHLFLSISSCNQMSLQVHPLCSNEKKKEEKRKSVSFVVEEREKRKKNEIVDFVVVVCVFRESVCFPYLQCLE
jgi:hypothetical protein